MPVVSLCSFLVNLFPLGPFGNLFACVCGSRQPVKRGQFSPRRCTLLQPLRGEVVAVVVMVVVTVVIKSGSDNQTVKVRETKEAAAAVVVVKAFPNASGNSCGKGICSSSSSSV